MNQIAPYSSKPEISSSGMSMSDIGDDAAGPVGPASETADKKVCGEKNILLTLLL